MFFRRCDGGGGERGAGVVSAINVHERLRRSCTPVCAHLFKHRVLGCVDKKIIFRLPKTKTFENAVAMAVGLLRFSAYRPRHASGYAGNNNKLWKTYGAQSRQLRNDETVLRYGGVAIGPVHVRNSDGKRQ